MSGFQVGDFRKICRFEKKHLSFLNDLERQRIVSSTHFDHQPTWRLRTEKHKLEDQSLVKRTYIHIDKFMHFLVIGGFPWQSGSKVRWKRTPHMLFYIGSLVKIASHQWWSSTLLLREWQTIRFGISFLSGVSLSHLKDAKNKTRLYTPYLSISDYPVLHSMGICSLIQTTYISHTKSKHTPKYIRPLNTACNVITYTHPKSLNISIKNLDKNHAHIYIYQYSILSQVGGFNPLEQYAGQIGSFPQVGN